MDANSVVRQLATLGEDLPDHLADLIAQARELQGKVEENPLAWAHEIARGAYASLVEMVERLENPHTEDTETVSDLLDWFETEGEEPENPLPEGAVNWHKSKLSEAIKAGILSQDDANTYLEARNEEPDTDLQEKAREAILDDALSVEIGGWWSPGSDPEPDEFRILLSTGGPAVRLIGSLGQHNEPDRVQLQVQDWFKPWTTVDYIPSQTEGEEGEFVKSEVLEAYAGCFYYGE